MARCQSQSHHEPFALAACRPCLASRTRFGPRCPRPCASASAPASPCAWSRVGAGWQLPVDDGLPSRSLLTACRAVLGGWDGRASSPFPGDNLSTARFIARECGILTDLPAAPAAATAATTAPAAAPTPATSAALATGTNRANGSAVQPRASGGGSGPGVSAVAGVALEGRAFRALSDAELQAVLPQLQVRSGRIRMKEDPRCCEAGACVELQASLPPACTGR